MKVERMNMGVILEVQDIRTKVWMGLEHDVPHQNVCLFDLKSE